MTEQGIRLIFVRHGETEWEQIKNPESGSGRLLGATDIGLSSRGEARARSVGVGLKGGGVSHIVTSSLKRARTTARLIAAELEIPVTEEGSFREINFGACEGLTFEELASSFPEVHAEYLAQGSEVMFPGGESFSVFRSRVEVGLAPLLAAHPGRTVLVVTHGGVIRVALCTLFKWPPEMFWNIKIEYGGITTVSVYGEKRILECVNQRVGSNEE